MRLLLAGSPSPLSRAFAARAWAAGHECVHWIGPRGAADPRAASQVAGPPAAAADIVARVMPEAVVQLSWRPRWRWHGPRLDVALEATARAAGRIGARLLLWQGTEVYGCAGSLPVAPRGEEAAVGDDGGARRQRAREELLLRVAAESKLRPVLLRAVPVADPEAAPLAPLLRLRLWPRAPSHRPLQLLHAHDAAAALLAALRAPSPGPYNVAPDGVVLYTTLRRSVGALPVPGPVAAIPAFGPLAPLACAWRWLTRSHVLDNARLKSHLGYRPRRTSAETLAEALTADKDQ